MKIHNQYIKKRQRRDYELVWEAGFLDFLLSEPFYLGIIIEFLINHSGFALQDLQRFRRYAAYLPHRVEHLLTGRRLLFLGLERGSYTFDNAQNNETMTFKPISLHPASPSPG